MIPASSLERVAEPLARADELARSRRQAEAGPPPRSPYSAAAFSIALSREVGARGTSVARAVGARLGWKVYDHELLERIAQDMKARVELLEGMDERQGSWLRECLEALSSSPTVSEAGYVRHLVETVLSLGAHGRCIIVGRGAAHILPTETTLRVRLVASWEDRLAVLGQERGLPRPEAAAYLRRTEQERAGFVREHFHKDPADPLHYDLVLNTSRFPVPESAELIQQALRRLEARGTGR